MGVVAPATNTATNTAFQAEMGPSRPEGVINPQTRGVEAEGVATTSRQCRAQGRIFRGKPMKHGRRPACGKAPPTTCCKRTTSADNAP